MSYILDALKKAERERRAAKVPTLQTVHLMSSSRQRRLWPWAGAAVVLASGALLIWLAGLFPPPSVKRSGGSTVAPVLSAPPPPVSGPETAGPLAERSAPAGQLQKQAVAAATPPEPAPSPGPPAARRPQPKSSPGTTTSRGEIGHTSAAALAPGPSRAETGDPTPAPVPRPKTAEKPEPAAPTTVPPPPQVAAVVPDAPPPAAAPAPTKPAEGDKGSLPGLPEMTSTDREAMPKMTLQFLVYSEVPAERLVFINNQKYVEGQSIDGKVKVETITPDGALLSYQGKRFMLRQ